MDIGWQEILIVAVIIVVLFVAVKMVGDKRWMKRSGAAKKGAPKENGGPGTV